jgi:hypothetical protein
LDVGNGWDGEVLLGGRCRECDCGLNIVRFETWEVGKNFFRRVARRKTGQHGPQQDACAPENRFATADLAVSTNAIAKWMVGWLSCS